MSSSQSEREKILNALWTQLIPKNTFCAELVPKMGNLTSPEEGVIVVSFVVDESFSNPLNNMHGGAIATIVDLVTTLAVISKDKHSRPGVSVDISTSYYKAIPCGTQVRVEGKAIKVGNNIAFAKAKFFDKEGNLAAEGKHTKALTPPPKL